MSIALITKLINIYYQLKIINNFNFVPLRHILKHI